MLEIEKLTSASHGARCLGDRSSGSHAVSQASFHSSSPPPPPPFLVVGLEDSCLRLNEGVLIRDENLWILFMGLVGNGSSLIRAEDEHKQSEAHCTNVPILNGFSLAKHPNSTTYFHSSLF